MRNILLLLIACLSFQYAFSQTSSDHVEDELIIWLEDGVDPYEFSESHPEEIKPKRVLSKRLNIWLFEQDESNAGRSSMSSMQASSDVKYIQYNHFIESRDVTPNDTNFGQQWAPSTLELPEAWDEYSKGGRTAQRDRVVIAVIDDGFDLDHTDLRFWRNRREIPNNGIDDDENGYVDDYDGWNAYNSSGNLPEQRHGTHVTGIAAARGNNRRGVSGVNWRARVMPVAGSTTRESVAVEAYSYVLEMRALYNETNGRRGAFVVVTNSSFGVDRGNPSEYPIWCSIYDEMGEVGILSCAATANANWNIDEVGDVPTACSSDYLVAVTNTTRSDSKYNSAGYGTSTIDIGAPGTSIYSTLPGSTYGNLTGTSMATPQVAGVIALMYSAACGDFIEEHKNNPGETALLMKEFLLDGATNLSSLNGLVAGSRRLNALGSIDAIYEYNTCANTSSTEAVAARTTSVEELSEELISGFEFNAYPNPSKGVLKLQTSEDAEVYVTNSLGMVVYKSAVESGATTSTDLGDLPAGIYYLNVKTDTHSEIKRIVITK